MKQVITKVLNNGSTYALGANFTSEELPLQDIYAPFIQLVVSDASSLDVDLTIEGTSDKGGAGAYQNYVTLTEFTSKNITGDGVSYWFLPKDMLSMESIRLKNIRTAGTGNLKVIVSGVRI